MYILRPIWGGGGSVIVVCIEWVFNYSHICIDLGIALSSDINNKGLLILFNTYSIIYYIVHFP